MQNRKSDAILELVEQIYAWADSEADCNPLVAMNDVFGAKKSALFRLDFSENEYSVLLHAGFTENQLRLILDARDHHDSFLRYARGWDQDNTYDAERLTAHTELTQTEYYRCVLKPLKLHSSIAGVSERTRHSCTVLVCYRSPEQPSFSGDELKMLGELMPHIRRATNLQERFHALASHSAATHRILDGAPFGIMLLSQEGQLLYANSNAQKQLNLRDGLYISNNHFCIRDKAVHERFIASLQSQPDTADETAVKPILEAITRPSGHKPYQLMGMRVAGGQTETDTKQSAAVFIYDPEQRLPVDTMALRSLEGLTEAEANLCESLYKTKNLNQSAQQLNVSVSTAKTHLLNTFRKLGINSQAELMRYLAHMPKIATENLRNARH